MSTITFDTLALVQELKQAGIPQDQAEAMVKVIAKAQAGLVTQEHFDHRIEQLETRMAGRFTLLQWMMGAMIALAVANFAKQFF
ncbi:MAG: hypothetical protein PHU46_05240 [Rhodocyclaceae bacterium]|nr:hypothetical protein [Rhodocyclaceae bacterium]